MLSSIPYRLVTLSVLFSRLIEAQSISSSDGYTGYSFEIRGDSGSVTYETASTPYNQTTVSEPDVYLNASVSIGEIDLTVSNLTAKINIDAQVLSLLQFNAGVDLSINRVALNIQNVTAKVLLEARLENLVLMINDTLSSIDLNPVIATLGSSVSNLVNNTVGAVSSATSSRALKARDFDLEHNILLSINDYSGNTHTNRILSQSGDIVEQSLHNDGVVYASKIVGSYWHDMTPTGHEHIAVIAGVDVKGLDYMYTPYAGLSVVSTVFVDASGAVIATRTLSESGGGGSSSIAND